MPAHWVTADEVYGDNSAFRTFLRDRRVGYVLAVGCHTRVTLRTGPHRVDRLAATLPARCWQRYSAGQGAPKDPATTARPGSNSPREARTDSCPSAAPRPLANSPTTWPGRPTRSR